MTGLEATPLEKDSSVLPQANPSDLPEVDVERNNQRALAHGAGEKEHFVATVSTNEEKRKICGLRRMVVFGIIAAVVIAAIVGGAVGGVLGNKKSSASSTGGGDGSPQSTPSSTPSDVPSSSNTTVLAPEPMRSIRTAQDQGTMFNVWQKSNGALWMRAYFRAQIGTGANKWIEPFQLQTTLSPIDNTPIAVVGWRFGDYFEVRVHYTATSQNTLTALVFRCNANGTSCSTPESPSIANSQPLSPGVGFAVVSPSLNVLRHYTINSDGLVSEAGYSPDSDWNVARPISPNAKAHKASPIAAGMVKGEIWVIWFDEGKRLQIASSVWRSGTWSQVQNISTTIPSQLPRSLGIAVSDNPQVVQLFFHDNTKIRQVRFSNGRWTTDDAGSALPEASMPNGPIGAAGWNDTALRLFYPVSGGKGIREVLSESGSAWKLGATWEDAYD